MAESGRGADRPGWRATLATIAILSAGVGIAYRLDRTYARWLTQISPLTGPRARYGRFKIRYRTRRADLSEFALIAFGVVEEIARARAQQDPH